jgi:hypothetical protein
VASPDAEALLPWSGPGAFPADNADVLHRARTSADVVLALVVLDPAVGAEHVARWCRSAVAVLRTGRTSATRARATGELLRAAGIDLRSAVLMGADATDDSVGTVPLRRQAPEPDAGVVAW